MVLAVLRQMAVYCKILPNNDAQRLKLNNDAQRLKLRKNK